MSSFETPHVDWAGLSPYLVLLGGATVVLLGALFMRGSRRNAFGATISALTLIGAGAAAIALYVLDDTPGVVLPGLSTGSSFRPHAGHL